MHREPISLPVVDHSAEWLAIRGVRKQFGSFTALAGIDLNIRKGEFLCLLGPSGCGKTTLLRILAGLERQDSGRLQMAGRDIGALPPAKRDFGIVFQSYALFPNMTVADNIAYGLRTSRAEKAKRVNELLDMVGLGGANKKYPAQLSGGQQQRIALARALATSPSLLLLDEPLSALDAQVRESLRVELRRLQEKLGVTTVMVTHDQEEALTMADSIAVMSNGHLEQLGTPEQIYREPTSRFVAEFVGKANWLPVSIDEAGSIRYGSIVIANRNTVAVPPGVRDAQLFFRPEDVQIGGSNALLLAQVERVDFLGGLRRATLSLPGRRDVILVDVNPNSPAYAALETGKRVPIAFETARLRVFMEPTK